jgi:DNA-binding NarL/FixJ family response regulator
MPGFLDGSASTFAIDRVSFNPQKSRKTLRFWGFSKAETVPQLQVMTNDSPIRILSVDDHPLFRQGIAAIINCQPDMSLVGAASNGTEAIEAFRSLRPDVTLMDLNLPDICGIEVMTTIREEFAEARVIVLTTFGRDVEIQRALKAGARGYLLKSMLPEQMLETIRQVHAGKKPVLPEIASELAEHLGDEQLTNREVDVLRQVTEGNRNRDIAERLFVSEHTVKTHLKHILGKLGASDRTHAITIAARRGIIQI